MDKMHLKEIQLSRELAKTIEQLDEQYRGIIPKSVWNAYVKLRQHYQEEIDKGVQ